jgi:hypothetical protein
MSSTPSQAIPWGRSFAEYRGMFALSDGDLSRRILGCADGPASFNAEATEQGCSVVSADPIYQLSASEIELRVKALVPDIVEQARRNAKRFDWTHFRSVDDLIAARLGALSKFIEDYSKKTASARYVAASLPNLPFLDGTFDLAVCSHLLFLYGEHLDAPFHVKSILELARVAQEVRVFPLLELGSHPSRHLSSVVEAIRAEGLAVSTVRVPYEFQIGGNEMLRVLR